METIQKKMTILRPLRGWTELVQVAGVESRQEIHAAIGQSDLARGVLVEEWDRTKDDKVREKGRWVGMYRAKHKLYAVSGNRGEEPDCCMEYKK